MPSSRSVQSDESGGGPLEVWRPGEVWFRPYIPTDLPWGSETFLESVPEEAVGAYGIKTGSAAQVDGQRYEAGDIVLVDSEEELERLLPAVGSATDLIFPWYDRLVPAALFAPHQSRIDLATYRADFSAGFLRALLLTLGLLAAGYALPDFRILALLLATFYGLYPMVESGLAWLRHVDRYSVEELNRRLVNFELFRRWLGTRRSPLLMGSLAVLGLLFLGQISVGLVPSFEAAALVKSRVIQDREWWRLVTAGLLHGNLMHILFNGMALYSLGRVLVALVSPSLLSCLFLISVTTGSLASLWLGPADKISVGASGGILGCLGFLLVVTFRFSDALPGFLRSNLLQSCIVVSIFGFLGNDFIDNAAHAGGFLGGLLLGLVSWPWLRLAPPRPRPVTRLFSALSLAVLTAAVAKTAWELWRLVP